MKTARGAGPLQDLSRTDWFIALFDGPPRREGHSMALAAGTPAHLEGEPSDPKEGAEAEERGAQEGVLGST